MDGLYARGHAMRRLSSSADDSGLVMVMTALALTGLCIVAALVLDIGAKASAHQAAQNTADAGALAAAIDCAKAVSCGTTSMTRYQVAGATASAPIIDTGAGTATVNAQKTVPFTFANVIGISSGTGHGTATAKWGVIGGVPTIPITISNCEFTQALLDGTTDVVFYLDDPKPQSGCSSLPGGFSQLLTTSKCTTAPGNPIAGDPGGDLQKLVTDGCITPLPKDLLIPMYDSAACKAAGCNGHGPYPILGYAMLHLTGYSLNGSRNAGTLGKNCRDPSRGKYCIEGDFIRFVTETGTVGTGTNFGVTTVTLIK